MRHLTILCSFLFVIMGNFGYSQNTLIAPSQGFTFLEDSVFFSWNEVGEEQFFELSLDDDIGFVSPTNYTVFSSDTLISGIQVDQYFWRVRSFSNGVFGNWSGVRNFTRINLSDFGTIGLWLDANDLTGLQNGNYVSSWEDKSMNNYDLAQSSSALQPIFSENAFGDKHAVYFDGTDQLSNLSSNVLGTHFAFFQHSNSPQAAVFGLNAATGNPRFFISLLTQSISTGFSTAFPIGSVRRNLTTTLSSPLNSFNLTSGVRTAPTNIANYCIAPNHGAYVRLIGSVYEIIAFQNALSSANISLVENYLRYKYSPPINLGKDKIVEYGFCEVNLDSNLPYSSYLWSTGDTTSSINVNQSGTYWLQTTDVLGLISVDTILVKYKEVALPLSTLFCPGDVVSWNAGLGVDYDYSWSGGETTETISINSSGAVNVVVTDSLGCQLISDPILFEEDNYASFVSLGADTSLCAGNTINLLSGDLETVSYLWSDFSTNNLFSVISTGNVFVQTMNSNGCIANDTIFVTVTGQAPNIDFNAPNQCSNLSVNFTDLSTNIISDPVNLWYWSFGDGNFSSDQNPNHFYSSAGSFSVNLIVESQGGCSSQLTKNVLVRQIPNANFNSVGQCSNGNVQFTNSSSNGSGSNLSFEWEFGMLGAGSNNFSTEINPLRIYQDAGSYNVTLIATDEFGCKDTNYQTKVILQSPSASFDIEDNCVEAPFECINTSVVEPFATYLWNFDDFTSSILANPYKVFSMPGAHEISLLITAENGCVDEFIDTIFIHPNPIASYDIGPHCFGTYMNLYSSSTISSGTIATNQWSINSGNQLLGDTITHFVDLMGQNQVVLTSISDQGCQNVFDQFFNVSESFNAAFSTVGSVVSQGDDFLFTNTTQNSSSSNWDFGDGQSSLEFSPIHNYSSDYIDSTLEVLLISQNSSGCVDSVKSTIQILSPQLDLELQNLYVQSESGFYDIGVRMKNLGSKRIEKVDFFLSSQRGDLFSERWEGTLLPLESIVYLFSAKPAVNISDQDDLESFVCVRSVGYDNENLPETYLDNNRLCKNLESESILLMPIYPNPVVDHLTIEFLITLSTNVEIEMLDMFGRKVKNILVNQFLEPGLRTIVLSTSELVSGNYYIRLKSDETQILRSLIILR